MKIERKNLHVPTHHLALIPTNMAHLGKDDLYGVALFFFSFPISLVPIIKSVLTP